VLRTPHVSDGRATSLALTAEGRTVLEDTMRDVVARFGELWDSLAGDEREQAVRLVRRLSRIATDLT
jgi:DNA-binding MarR family transcriptional regulator